MKMELEHGGTGEWTRLALETDLETGQREVGGEGGREADVDEVLVGHLARLLQRRHVVRGRSAARSQHRQPRRLGRLVPDVGRAAVRPHLNTKPFLSFFFVFFFTTTR